MVLSPWALWHHRVSRCLSGSASSATGIAFGSARFRRFMNTCAPSNEGKKRLEPNTSTEAAYNTKIFKQQNSERRTMKPCFKLSGMSDTGPVEGQARCLEAKLPAFACRVGR